MELKYKLIVVGDTGVGKTSLLKRRKENVYDKNFTSTLGVDFYHINFYKNKQNIKIYIWDTAGQEKFSNLINVYFRDIDGAMVLYDTTNEESFNNTKKWIEKIRFYNNNNIPMILVGTKIDIKNKYKIDEDIVSSFITEHNLLHSICSSKEDINIKETFEIIINEMYNKNPDKKIKYVELEVPQKKNCCVIL